MCSTFHTYSLKTNFGHISVTAQSRKSGIVETEAILDLPDFWPRVKFMRQMKAYVDMIVLPCTILPSFEIFFFERDSNWLLFIILQLVKPYLQISTKPVTTIGLCTQIEVCLFLLLQLTLHSLLMFNAYNSGNFFKIKLLTRWWNLY